MKKLIFLGAAAAALLATPTLAQLQQQSAGAGLTRAEVAARVSAQFAKVDANRDGAITKDEGQAFRGAARTQRRGERGERREAAFARLDADGDGSISRAEFLAPRAAGDRAERRENRAERRSERRAERMERRGQRGLARFAGRRFDRIDADRDGRITLAEATAQRLQRFDRIDKDRDGVLTREERQAALAERQSLRG